MCTCIYICFPPDSYLWMACGGASDSISGVCRYVFSQFIKDGMHVCISAFSLYAGERYAFVVVPCSHAIFHYQSFNTHVRGCGFCNYIVV